MIGRTSNRVRPAAMDSFAEHVRPLAYAARHETSPAGASSPPLGRRPERRWPEAEVRAQECPAPQAPDVPSGHAARHGAHAAGSLEPAHASLLPRPEALLR